MGFSIADQLNQLPRGMDGQVLTGSDPREMDGTFNTPDPQVGTPAFQDPNTTYQGPGQVSMPGLGGKGGGGPLAQIPIDMQGNLLGPEQPPMPMPMPMPEPTSMPGLPPAPNAQIPLGKVSGGTLGRPSPSAPIVPRGPGFNNPGAPGAPPPQPPERGILTNPQGQNQPLMPGPSRPVNAGMVRPPRNFNQPVAMPGATMGGMNPVRGARPAQTIAQPVSVARRGAGRGGLLR